MTDKKGKRAVIISNIKSSSIEQAIFILKSPTFEGAFDMSDGIVAEAQSIINSYINTIEKKAKRKSKKSFWATAFFGGAVCFLMAAILFFIKF